MIVDIAHCSAACVADILKIARRPVVSSHGGVQATCKVNRNLSDEQIKDVAATGGLIGIGYWDAAVCDTSPASIAKAMKHVRDLVGVQHRSEEHTSELQSLMRISYAVFCLKKKNTASHIYHTN